MTKITLMVNEADAAMAHQLLADNPVLQNELWQDEAGMLYDY